MNEKQLLLAFSLYLSYSSVLSHTVLTEVDYTQSKLSDCATNLSRLILCLSDDKPIYFGIRKCDDILTRTVLCLANKRPENPFEHASLDVDGSDEISILKRGLGRCIHKCLNGQGRMNFIQCKSMCHR